MAELDRPNNGAILGNLVGTIVAIVVVTVGVFEYVKYEMRGEIREKTTLASTFLREHRAEEDHKLGRSTDEYQWVDEKAGVVRIPLDKAVELTLRDWSNRKPAVTAKPAEEKAPAPTEGAAPAEDGKTAPAEEGKAGDDKKAPEDKGKKKPGTKAPAPKSP